jgi:hypothetical protein
MIETNWKLTAPAIDSNSAALQDALYDGAKYLIREDRFAREAAMAWLNEHGVVLKGMVSDVSKRTPYRSFSKHNVRIMERNSGFPTRVKCD